MSQKFSSNFYVVVVFPFYVLLSSMAQHILTAVLLGVMILGCKHSLLKCVLHFGENLL